MSHQTVIVDKNGAALLEKNPALKEAVERVGAPMQVFSIEKPTKTQADCGGCGQKIIVRSVKDAD